MRISVYVPDKDMFFIIFRQFHIRPFPVQDNYIMAYIDPYGFSPAAMPSAEKKILSGIPFIIQYFKSVSVLIKVTEDPADTAEGFI